MSDKTTESVEQMTGEDIAAELDLIRERASELTASDTTPEIVDEIESLGARRSALRDEMTKREAAAAELEDRKTAALAALGEGEDDSDGGDESGDAADDAPAESEPETPDEPITEPEAVTVPEAAQVAASAKPTRKLAAIRKPQTHKARSFESVQNTRSFKIGQSLDALNDVAKLFVEQRASLPPIGQGRDLLRLASYRMPIDETRHLRQGDGLGNSERIEAALGETARVASGGYCAPLEGYYTNQDAIATADRPIRDALAGFTSDRGGIRFIPPVSFADASGAITVWTAANDAAQTPNPATKDCLTIDCDTEVEVEIDAIVRCLTFGNFGARSGPERVAGALANAIAQQASVAEASLLTTIQAGSTAATRAAVVSTFRDVTAAVGLAATGYRARHRMSPTAPLDVFLPAWVRDAMRDDILNQRPGDRTFAMADAEVLATLTARNVRVTWTIEDVNAPSWAQGAGALTEYPNTVTFYIFAPGTWLFLDGATLDLGIVRDSTLNSTNDFNVFAETFEAAALIGHESVEVEVTVCPTGETAGDLAAAITCP